MTAPAADVLSLAQSAGVSLRVHGGRIIAAPKRAMDEKLRELIRANKDALLRVLTAQVADVAHVALPTAKGSDYTLADLAEVDRLLRELANLEEWPADELSQKLDQRQRMAPVRVPGALQELRAAHKAALAIWPNRPSKRSEIALCHLTVIDGGKRDTSERGETPKSRAA